MHKLRVTRLTAFLFLLSSIFVANIPHAAAAEGLDPSAVDAQRASEEPREPSNGPASLPLYISAGASDSESYVLRGGDKVIHFGPASVAYSLWGLSEAVQRTTRLRQEQVTPQRWNVRLEFLGARTVLPVPSEPTPTRISHFRGPQSEWRTGLATYRQLTYPGLWPGIDLVYEVSGRRLKYHFVVKPGADPAQIRLVYRGARTRVTERGTLRVSTPVGGFEDEAPAAFQAQATVPVQFDTTSVTDSAWPTVGFRLGKYDSTRELIIDPAVVVYSGFLGGLGMDGASAVAVDATGAAYLTGYTMSAEDSFPTAVGPDTSFNTGTDAFVAKVSPDGMNLLYAGYIGGSSDDAGHAIAVGPDGAAYVVGMTASTEATFPTAGALGATHNGDSDAFLAKVSPDGTALLFSGYIGGSGADSGAGVAIDALGAAYVTGSTSSADGTFPTLAGPALAHSGESDAFVAKVAADGSALVYSGFLGGSGTDRGRGIAVDPTGAAYLTGETSSSEASFPATNGPGLTFNGAADTLDAFVAKVAADGSALTYAGYIGGAEADSGYAIAVDSTGTAYIAGKTASDETTFPVTAGPFADRPSSTFAGAEDGFVARVAADGSALLTAGYLGGSGMDAATSIALGPQGLVFVTGYTGSTDFPTVAAADDTANGMTDAFLVAATPTAEALLYASYLGGASADSARGVAVDPSGDVYVAGETTSTEADFPTAAGPDLAATGASDAYVAKFRLGVPYFTSEAVVNGASFAGGPIAPGQIISIFGTGLASPGPGGVPPEGLGAVLDSDGKLATERGGTKVLFDGDPAPLYFVSERQINAQAPYSLDGKATVSVEIMTLDGTTPPVEVAVAPTAPGMFVGSPAEAGIIAVNPDGSINSAENPAAAGDVLMLFATGEGQTDPPGVTGALAAEPLPEPLAPLSLTIGGAPAELLFAGSAPGFAGLLQINAVVPTLTAPAALSAEGREQGASNPTVLLTIGDAASQSGTELYVTLAPPPPSTGPVAVDDRVSTPEDTPVTVSVLANDSHPDGLALTVVATSTPVAGTAVINPTGTITFTPKPNFTGATSFGYTIQDSEGEQSSARVIVVVGETNDPPDAVRDSATTIEETPVVIPVLANDSDPEGNAISVSGIVDAFGGTAAINPGGTVTFTPADDFVGTANFTYALADSGGLTDTARVTITVTEDGTLPIANDDIATVDEDGQVVIPILLNDVNNEPGPLTVLSVSAPANGTATINPDGTVTYTPNPNFNGTDTFTYTNVDADNPDSDETATATVTVTVRIVTDIVIQKSMVSASFTAGAEADYNVTLTNNGPSDATDATVTDTLPDGLTFVAAGSSAECSAVGSLITCGPLDLAEGASATLSIRVAIASSATGSRTNTAAVTQADDPASPKSASVTNEIEIETDVSVTKTNGVDGLVSGAQTTYTITVTNAGPSDAIGATVTDTLPAALTDASWTCVPSAGASCTSGPVSSSIADTVNIPAGGSVTYTLIATVASSATGSLVNTATAMSDADRTGSGSATDVDALSQDADLSITKTPDTADINAGASVTYTLTVVNNGPSDASTVVVTDTFPASLTHDTNTCAATVGSAITWNVGSLAAGQQATCMITFDIAAAATGTAVNSATVVADQPDSNPANNTATTANPIIRVANLAITKTPQTNSVTAGQALTYDLTVTNNGPADTTNVLLTDLVPTPTTAGTLTFSAAGSTGSCLLNSGTIECALGDLAAGASAMVQIAFDVSADAVGSIPNSASAQSDAMDPDGAMVNATAVTITREADLTITKSGPATIVAGTTATFTVMVTNNGPSSASNVLVADALPTGALTNGTLTFNAAASSSGCSLNGSTVQCAELTLGPASSTSFTVALDVSSDATGSITNTASVTADETDPTVPNTAATTAVTVTQQADLAITKALESAPVAGQSATYAITVSNLGPSDVIGALVNDTFPASLSGVSWVCAAGVGSTCPAAGSGNITNISVDIPAGRSVTFTATGLLAADATGVLSNTATVSSAIDAVTTNNSATSMDTITFDVALAASKALQSGQQLQLGQMANYIVTVTHISGTSFANNVRVTDTLDGQLSFVSSGSSAGCSASGQDVTCTALTPIPPGGSAMFTIRVQVNN